MFDHMLMIKINNNKQVVRLTQSTVRVHYMRGVSKAGKNNTTQILNYKKFEDRRAQLDTLCS